MLIVDWATASKNIDRNVYHFLQVQHYNCEDHISMHWCNMVVPQSSSNMSGYTACHQCVSIRIRFNQEYREILWDMTIVE